MATVNGNRRLRSNLNLAGGFPTQFLVADGPGPDRTLKAEPCPRNRSSLTPARGDNRPQRGSDGRSSFCRFL